MAFKSSVCILLCFSICAVQVSSHIPMRYYNSAEPDAPIYVPNPSAEKLSRQTSLERVTAVRNVLAQRGVDAYVIPTADAHNSQYISPADARREWVSGLRGSSGTCVVTATSALVWTDNRYFTQFYVEVDTTVWGLMRQGTDASIQQWLVDNMPANSVVGIDPTTYTRSSWIPLKNALRQANITLLATPENLVDIARVNINDGPPSRPSNALLPLTMDYTGNITLLATPENLVDIARVNIDDGPPSRPSNALLPLTMDYTGNITLLATSENLVDIARVNINDGPPSRPSNALLPLTMDYTGNITLLATTENLVDIARVNIDDGPPSRPSNALLPLTMDYTGNITLLATTENLVDIARVNINDGPPSRPSNALLPLTMDYTGNITLLATTENLVDIARVNINDGPPSRPSNALLPLTMDYTGNITLLATTENLVDIARVNINDGPPSRPSNALLPLTMDYTGNITLLATPENLVDIARVNINDGPPSRPSNALLPLTMDYTGNITLLATTENLVDIARVNIDDGPPSRPSNALLPLTMDYTGRASSDKLAELQTQIRSRGASALILTALDEVAYTLNLRGTDIPYNPMFFAYLVIRTDVAAPNNVILFWNDGVLSSDVQQHLATEGVQITARPYVEIFEYMRSFTSELPYGSSVWLSEEGSHAIYLAVENDGQNEAVSIISTVSPVALIKVMKNQVELEGFRKAHIKDGVAVVRSLHWVHQQVDEGVPVTEMQLSDKMVEFRSEEEDFMGPSFSTIAGAGENGAIIHYSPTSEGPQRVITKEDMLLVDSGAQFKDGTTDITRTRHMSASPTPAQRLTFTRVLKGQINLGTAVFPAGTTGHTIEVLARKYLWDVGLNYGHGTGHGVGHYLNVHEGPTWILSGPAANDPGIRPGMVYSNEPGYYEVDEYGIRHEDLVETIQITRDADHPYAQGMVSDFEGRGAVGFYTISLAPHQTACLDVNLLTDFEIKFLNDYHARVFSTIGPILLERGLTEDYEWLEKECAPVQRSAAILIKSSPLLALVAVLRVWLA